MSDRGVEHDNSTQWSERYSPLRIAYGKGVPGWNNSEWLFPPVDRVKEVSDYAKQHPFTEAGQVQLVMLPWKEALSVSLHCASAGVRRMFDEDGTFCVSGYELHAAGLSDGLTIKVTLSAKQKVELFSTSKQSQRLY